MKRKGATLALGLVLLCVLPETSRAQMPAVSVSAEAAGQAYTESRYQAAVTLEVLPLEAEVRLDGVRIGSARELVAIAVPVTPGWHTVEVAAPGHFPHAARFVADQHSSANLVVVTLVPVR